MPAWARCPTPTSAGPTARPGRILVSPAYHRLHHAATGRLDINPGTVFALWDAASRRAVWPARNGQPPIETGLGGRPVPVEQSGPRPHAAPA